MTPNEAISLLKGQLGNWSSTNIDVAIINEMQAAQRRLERGAELPWFLWIDTDEAGTNLTLSANTERVALPTNFLREDDDADISPVFKYDAGEDDVWTALIKKDYSKIKQENPGVGTLYYYDILGSNLYFRHVPDVDTTIRMLYYRKDTVITAGTTETLWLQYAPDLIIAEAGKVIAGQYLKDMAAMQAFAARSAEEQSILVIDNTARREAGYKRMMGDED
jgi:hypothetical protein